MKYFGGELIRRRGENYVKNLILKYGGEKIIWKEGHLDGEEWRFLR